jgi:hypothetical protein
MKAMKVTLLFTIHASMVIQAVDLRTDVVCKNLLYVITQGQLLAIVQAEFEQVVSTTDMSAVQQIELAMDVVAYAQEQKEETQKLIAALANQTYDTSKIAWGGLQLLAGVFCEASVWRALLISMRNNSEIDFLAIPDKLPLSKLYLRFIARYIESPNLAGISPGIQVLTPVELILYAVIAPFLLYTGGTLLYQGIYCKQLLEVKVANLEATISYFQELVAGS